MRRLCCGGAKKLTTPVAVPQCDSNTPTNEVDPTIIPERPIDGKSQCDSDAYTKPPTHSRSVALKQSPLADEISPKASVTPVTFDVSEQRTRVLSKIKILTLHVVKNVFKAVEKAKLIRKKSLKPNRGLRKFAKARRGPSITKKSNTSKDHVQKPQTPPKGFRLSYEDTLTQSSYPISDHDCETHSIFIGV